MPKSGSVGGHESAGDVDRDPACGVLRQRPSREALPQRLAVEQLHHEERPSVVHAHVEQPHDVRTVERGGDTGFLNEALHHAGLVLTAA